MTTKPYVIKPYVPQPPVERRARLRVIPAKEHEQGQDCGTCRNQPNCWMRGIKEEHVITNLLVCRIKRGIEVNRSAKLFLQMVRPKLKSFAKLAIRGTSIDMDTAIADMESETINYIQHHYVMGEVAYPLHRLFSPQNGHITFYARNYAKRTRLFEDNHVLDSGDEVHPQGTEGGAKTPLWDRQRYTGLHGRPVGPCDDVTIDEDEDTQTEMTRVARAIIDDGITLSLSEYRVLAFCLANAGDAKRPLNGLHVYLARTMGAVRARVTKMYADATRKLVEETRASR